MASDVHIKYAANYDTSLKESLEKAPQTSAMRSPYLFHYH